MFYWWWCVVMQYYCTSNVIKMKRAKYLSGLTFLSCFIHSDEIWCSNTQSNDKSNESGKGEGVLEVQLEMINSKRHRKLLNCDLQHGHSVKCLLLFVLYICLSICRFVKGNVCRKKFAHCFVLSTLKSVHF